LKTKEPAGNSRFICLKAKKLKIIVTNATISASYIKTTLPYNKGQ
jgi:hypothetical protein